MRYPQHVRWTGRLQQILGSGFQVLEEGLKGRTTVFTDPVAEYRNGKHLLPAILDSHAPLDAVVLMLGTNDCKLIFHANAAWIARGASTLIEIIRCHTPAQILLVSPAPIEGLTEFAGIFAEQAQVSHNLAAHFSRVAIEQKTAFLNAGEYCRVSPLDGLHLDADAHAALACAIAAVIREMLP
jgi:lysophospholipase L1-like esterase